MKNLFKKIGSVLIGAAMLAGTVNVALAEPMDAINATDGYFWYEGESAKEDSIGSFNGTWGVASATGFNGGKALTVSTEEANPRVQFKINVTEAGNYKVVMNSSAVHNWASAQTLHIGENEVNLTRKTGDSWPTGSSWVLNWFEGDAVYLEAQEYTVEYKLTAPVGGNGKTYMGTLDSIAIMPEDYAMETAVGKKPVAPVTASFNNGYVWAELETAKSNVTLSEKSDAKLSGGKGYYMYIDNGVPAGTTHTFEYSVTFPKSVSYRFAVNGTNNANEWSAPIKVKIDDGEIVKLTSCGNAAWTSDKSGYNVGWNSADIDVTAGKHKVTVLINEPSTSGKQWNQYKYLLDALCISEADWDWTPSITNMPKEPKRVTAAWIEDTDVTSMSGFSSKEVTDKFNGGTALYVRHTDNNATTQNFYVDLPVSIAADGEYDVYMRGPIVHAWASAPVVTVDGNNADVIAISVSDNGTSWVGTNDNAFGWIKVRVNMTRGEHTVRYAIKDKLSGSTAWNIWAGVFDFAIVIPSSFENVFEVQESANANSLKADYNVVAAFANANSGIDMSKVTDDITLPATTEDGTAISWTSGDTSVIGNDGKVTRGDKDVNVNLVAEYGDNNMKSFSVTVKKLADYDVESFELNGTVTAGQTIKANASLKSDKGLSAMCIVALYDKDGKMLASDIDSKTINTTTTTFEAEITAPSDLESGAYAKAFLWSGMETLIPIVTSITK